jgi:hypothetical protein
MFREMGIFKILVRVLLNYLLKFWIFLSVDLLPLFILIALIKIFDEPLHLFDVLFCFPIHIIRQYLSKPKLDLLHTL